MEEILRTVKTVVGVLLIIILSRVLYDVLTSVHEDSSHWALAGLVLTLISIVTLIGVQSYVLSLPVWVHIWHIINLVVGVVSIYYVVLAVRRDD